MAWRRCPRPLPTPATSSFTTPAGGWALTCLGQYARALGLGEKTGIELAGEQAGGGGRPGVYGFGGGHLV